MLLLLRSNAGASNVVASETWTGTNGAAWPSQWTAVASPGTIQGNAGVLTSGSQYANAREDLTGLTGQGNIDYTVTVTATTGAVTYFSFDSDNTGTGYAPQNAYYLQIGWGAGGYAQLVKQVAGNAAGLSYTGTSYSTGTPYRVRVQRIGTTIQYKVWLASGTEPSAWDTTTTDTGTLLSGSVSLSLYSNIAGSATATYDDLTVNNGTTGSPAYTGTASFTPTVGLSATGLTNPSGVPNQDIGWVAGNTANTGFPATITRATHVFVVPANTATFTDLVGSSADGGFRIYLTSDNRVQSYVSGSGGAYITQSNPVIDRTRANIIAIEYDTNTGAFATYLNGQPIGTDWRGTNTITFTGTGTAVVGPVTEYQRYTRPLTGTELRTLFTNLGTKYGITQITPISASTPAPQRRTGYTGGNQHPKAAQGSGGLGVFEQFWGAQWDWTWVQDSIDRVYAVGGTVYRLIGDIQGIAAGTITQTTYSTRLTQIADYIASKGMLLYYCGSDLNQHGNATQSDLVGQYLAAAQILQNHASSVYGFDLANELRATYNTASGGVAQATSTQWLQAASTAIRASYPGIPLSISDLGGSGSDDGGSAGSILGRAAPFLVYQSWAPYIDFFDLHAYEDSEQLDSWHLAPYDIAIDRPLSIGEFGVVGTDFTQAGGDAAGAAMYGRVKTLRNASRKLSSVSVWAIRGDAYGLYSETNGGTATPRTQSIAAYSDMASTGAPNTTVTAPFTPTVALLSAGSASLAIGTTSNPVAFLAASGTANTSLPAALSPTANLSATPASASTSPAPFTPTGTLTAAATPRVTAPTAFTASPTLAASTTAAGTQTSTLTPTVGLTATGAPATVGTAPFTPTVSLTSSGAAASAASSSAPFTPTVTTTAAAVTNITAPAPFTVAASMTATSTAAPAVATSFTPTVALTATRTPATSQTAPFTPTVGITSTGNAVSASTGTAAFTPAATVTATSTITQSAAAPFTATATIAAMSAAQGNATGAAPFTATPTLTATPAAGTTNTGAFTPTVVLAATPAFASPRSGTFTVTTTLTAVPAPAGTGAAGFTASVTATATPAGTGAGNAPLTATTTLGAAPTPAVTLPAPLTTTLTLGATRTPAVTATAAFTPSVTVAAGSGIPKPTTAVGFAPTATLASTARTVASNTAVLAVAVVLAAFQARELVAGRFTVRDGNTDTAYTVRAYLGVFTVRQG